MILHVKKTLDPTLAGRIPTSVRHPNYSVVRVPSKMQQETKLGVKLKPGSNEAVVDTAQIGELTRKRYESNSATFLVFLERNAL